jgi:type II secretory ATPase GspE/PulE/Tfp pilus assembly ATPase PilB-like protein
VIATDARSAAGVLTGLIEQGAMPSDCFDTLVRYAAHRRAGDLFISALRGGYGVSMRCDGMLCELGEVTREWGTRLIGYAKVEATMDPSEHRRPQDGRVMVLDGEDPIDVRISSMPTAHGEDMALRILDRRNQIFDMDRLGLSVRLRNVVRSLIHQPHGLVLVSGSTGSGKTTTLYTILHQLNDGTRKINTLEDPVEFHLPGVHQSQINLRIGMDFADLLPAALRQDPDIIMVGEVRDTVTATTAVRAAATGQLVFATLHATKAAGAIHSMVGLGAHPHLVAGSLRGVIAQHLVRRICKECEESFECTASLNLFEDVARLLPQDAGGGEALAMPLLHQGRGCEACNHTGYRHRAGLFEVLTCSSEIEKLIETQATPETIEAQAIREGMIPLRESAKLLVAQGVTTLEETMRILDLQR